MNTVERRVAAWVDLTGDLITQPRTAFPRQVLLARLHGVPRALVTDQGRALVRDHLLPIGMEQQMSVPYRLGSQHHRAFILARGGRDFSQEDLHVARQLQPLLRLLGRSPAGDLAARCTGICRTSTASSGSRTGSVRSWWRGSRG